MTPSTRVDAAEDDELIFQWKWLTHSRWRLALMLLLSLLAHAASFYVFQVAYTPTGSLLPPPAQVMLVPPDSPENAALARWIDTSDPSVMTQPQALAAGQILNTLGFHYVPSYATVLQVFKPLPGAAPAETPPRTRKPAPVPAGLLPPLHGLTDARLAAGGRPSPVASRTAVVLSANLQALLTSSPPAVPPPANPGLKTLERTVFLVGVPPEGGPAWLFEQASSGDATENGADVDARAFLERLRFKAPDSADGGAAWGWAAFSWGRDAYPPGSL